MRILIISTFFPPLNSIASLRPYSWAKYWALAGHDVTVLTTKKAELSVNLKLDHVGYTVIEVPEAKFIQAMRKDYQKGNQMTGSLKFSLKNWTKQKLLHLFNQLRKKTGIFSSCRMPDFADLWIWPAIKTIKDQGSWDLVISTAGPYAVHLIGAHLKKHQLAKKWVADYRDTWSNSYIYKGLFPFNWIEKILERKLLGMADYISTISQPFAEGFARKYGKKKVLTIENGFDPCDLENIDLQNIFPDDGKFRLVHTGTIYSKRNPEPLFQAISNLKKTAKTDLLSKLEVLFVGPNQGNIPELIKKYQVEDWVKLTGFVSRENALRMQRDAHALLFLPWNDPKSDGVLTGKLFEYLYANTPILAVGGNGLEASQQLILEAKAGKIFNTNKELEEYFIKNVKQPQKKNSVDANFLKQYDRQSLAMKLLQYVDHD